MPLKEQAHPAILPNMKKHAPIAMALLALVVALWNPVTAEPPPPDALKVRELHVVDAKGRTRIRLFVDKHGPRFEMKSEQDKDFGLLLYRDAESSGMSLTGKGCSAVVHANSPQLGGAKVAVTGAGNVGTASLEPGKLQLIRDADGLTATAKAIRLTRLGKTKFRVP